MKLTLEERSGILHADYPRLVRDKKPCEVGTTITVSAQVTLEVEALRRTRKGAWVVHYRVIDERPTLMRRVPPIHAGKRGELDAPNATDIARAHVDSSYTHSRHAAVSDGGEVVPAEYQNVLVVQARSRFVQHQELSAREQRAEQQVKHAYHQMRDVALNLVRQGDDHTSLLATVHRATEQAQANRGSVG